VSSEKSSNVCEFCELPDTADNPCDCYRCDECGHKDRCVCCPECELPPWSKYHQEHCSEALRG
jgi:hypothetical protein